MTKPLESADGSVYVIDTHTETHTDTYSHQVNVVQFQVFTSTGRMEPWYSRFTTATVTYEIPWACLLSGSRDAGRTEARAKEQIAIEQCMKDIVQQMS